jgi:hypothetical protein
VSAHFRTVLQAPRSWQRVRVLGVTGTGTTSAGCWNHQSRDGRYRKWWTDGTNIFISSSLNQTNQWEFVALVVTDEVSLVSEPRGAYGPDGILFLLYTYADTEVRERVSWDDGLTWSDYTVAFPTGTHPTISVSQNGTVLRACVSGGKVSFTRTTPDNVATAAAYFRDDTGTDLLVEDDTFHLVEGFRHDAPWMLVVKISGETDCSDWLSSDDGDTWKRL